MACAIPPVYDAVQGWVEEKAAHRSAGYHIGVERPALQGMQAGESAGWAGTH